MTEWGSSRAQLTKALPKAIQCTMSTILYRTRVCEGSSFYAKVIVRELCFWFLLRSCGTKISRTIHNIVLHVLMVCMVCTYYQLQHVVSSLSRNWWKNWMMVNKKIMLSCHYLEISILTKCLPVMKVMRGPHTVMWDRQGPSTIIERSIIGGGLILVMGIYRYDRLCRMYRD